MAELTTMRNVGPSSAAWLAAVGVATISDLRKIGAVAAYARVKRVRPQASLNLLWALEGAVEDVDWRDITADRKQWLRRELRRLIG
jgi:DNA transformation protein